VWLRDNCTHVDGTTKLEWKEENKREIARDSEV